MVRAREVRKRLNLDPSIELLVHPPYKSRLEVVEHSRTREFEEKAQALMAERKGAFDGTTWAVKDFSLEEGTLVVKVFESSYFKFLLTKKLRDECTLTSDEGEIPLCVQGLVYAEIPARFGRKERHYLFGLKTKGAIEGGTIAPVAGGFLDTPDLEFNLGKEFREETDSDIPYRTIDTGYIKLNGMGQFSFCYDIVVQDENKLAELDGKSTKEFPILRVIPHYLLPEFLEDPKRFFPEVNVPLKTAPMTNQMLDLHLKAPHY